MAIKTVYVHAKSKKEINERLTKGEKIIAWEYGMHLRTSHDITSLSHGDVIKVYEKYVGGSPYAKAYGNWDSKKGRVK